MSYCNNLLDPKQRRAKPTLRRTLSLAGCVLVSALSTAPATATFEDYLTQRWFTIEVIVFERSNIDDKNTLEALAHPRPVPTTDPLQIDAGTDADAGADAGYIDIQLAQPLPSTDVHEVLDELDTQLIPREPTEQRLRLETPAALEDPAAQALRLEFLQALTAYELELEARHLVFEADDNPRLEQELARLSRPRNISIVWRGHWLQAVPDRDTPQPLAVAVNQLDSGEFQLSGSLEVTVSRYLHLRAQLWYHDPAFGVDPGADLIAGELTGYGTRYTQAAEGLSPRTLPVPQEQSGRYTNQSNGQGLASSQGQQLIIEEPSLEQSLPEPLFMVLDETRRMRSGILHYLDHPKLGLLVRIDKLTPPAELLAQYKLFEASQK